MHAVHAGSDDEPSQGAIEGRGETEVAVMEKNDGEGDGLVEKKVRNC